ncbi:hypothetical protein GGH12_004930 [Coemansia sp. RSA 1822]|nr:hypothetical protein LPJ76_006022 [Coemansia sp. RSA 638]KAJ2120955.1 hypothetical protein IW147_004682 [Coemansia sp. RSA 720]KAJ2539408.1 hypothetical protein GGF49_005241 [Coemansia sp. RSA 1853]KAJ2560290.1 hypothetical protein GGH12_004930 [Coemansia sp. RSA 1822]
MTAPELSTGAQAAISKVPLVFRAIQKLMDDPYCKKTNPSGIINAGIAANITIQSLLLERLNSISEEFIASDLEYNTPYGSAALRTEIANIFDRHFAPVTAVSPEDIVVTNGCTGAIEMLTFAICNPGDHVLIPAPCYLALEGDMGSRAQGVVTPVQLPLEDSMDVRQIEYFEKAIADIKAEGKEAKMLFLMSPHNPLGASYPKKVLQAFLKFASKHNLYAVVDEIYALSVFDRSEAVAPFESVLSWTDLDAYIDPASVIVLHGLSKDFGLNGFRMGWALSPWNKNIINVLRCYSPFGYRPAYTDRIITKFLADREYIDSMLQISQRMLANNYQIITEFLNQHAIRYIPCTAGHFVWLQLPISACTKMLRARGEISAAEANSVKWTKENEVMVWDDLVDKYRVYIPTGQSFFSAEPGWFRLTFSIGKGELQVGLDRLLEACSS